MIFLRKASAILCLAVLPAASFAQLRIATYNLSNWDGSDRINDVKIIFFQEFSSRKLAPDAIVLQEFLSQAALTAFVNALNTAVGSPGDYAAPTFVNGADTDSVFCYRTTRIQFLQQVLVFAGSPAPTDPPRNIMRYDIRPVGYSSEGATISYYSSHMKAGPTQFDLDRRLIEAQKIRDNAETLPAARNFALGGDFNIPTASELAYQELVASQANNTGRFFDPIKSPGSWNSSAFRFIHTQDPAGGGGMDDRFDQILLSANLVDGSGFQYIGNPNLPFSTTTWNDPNHSYRCWGNDGSTYNTTLAVATNTNVGPTIAQALINAADGSGHLPVYLELQVPGRTGVSTTSLNLGKVFRTFKPPKKSFDVINVANVALWNVAGVANLTYTLSASPGFLVDPGPYSAAAGIPNTHAVAMSTQTSGHKTGTLTVTSNDPETPVRTISLSGYVVPFRGR